MEWEWIACTKDRAWQQLCTTSFWQSNRFLQSWNSTRTARKLVPQSTHILTAPDPGNNQDDSSNFPADSEHLWCFCQQRELDPSCTDHSDLPATFSLSFLHRPSWTGEMVKFIFYVYGLSILLLVQLNVVIGSPRDVPALNLVSPQLVSVCLFFLFWRAVTIRVVRNYCVLWTTFIIRLVRGRFESPEEHLFVRHWYLPSDATFFDFSYIWHITQNLQTKI